MGEQEAECRAVCAREGWTVLEPVLCDNDRSASRHAKRGRPAWDEIKHRIAAGGVDVLVTWEASRSARDLAEFVDLRALCRAHGVLVSYSGRTLDFDNSGDSFVAGLDALMSENEADVTRHRILRAVRGNAERGGPHGRCLFGYRREHDPTTGELLGQVPEPDEAKIVVEVARRYLSGESTYTLAADLNRRGVPFSTDARWSESRIKRMVTNPAYVARRVHRGEDFGPASWEAILDRAVFDQIAAKYDDPARAKYRGGGDLRYLLSGIARCGLCGAFMYVGGDRGRRVYVCREGKGHLGRSQEHLDKFVTGVLLERLATLDLDEFFAEKDDTIEARAEARELRDRLADAVEQCAVGELSPVMLGRLEAKLKPKIAAADRAARGKVVPAVVRDLAAGDREWDDLTIEQRREVVRLLLDVTVLPSKRPHGSRGFDPKSVKIEGRKP